MLFGSNARGSATQHSDIDILPIVVNETWPLKDAICDISAEIGLEFDVLFDVRVIGAERWQYMQNIRAGLFLTISQDAIPLVA